LSQLPALVVAIPLLAAAAIAATGHVVPGKVFNVLAVAVAVSMTVLSMILLVHTWRHDLVTWFGGWKPHDGLALGVAFTVDPFGAGFAALVGVLATAAFIFSWGYFERVGHLYYTLMLVFAGAMAGFSLTGDLFNLFVFFELMSVSAYALTGYQVEQPAILQGAINFAVTNSIGAFFVLFGIALLYGRTGALNLDQIGLVLARGPADGLVIAAFVALVVGFLVKAGAVPFHFWLADAYAVAPATVGVLLAGIMSELGLHAVARVYWLCFSGPLGGTHAGSVRALLVGVGVATAVLGAAMSLLQADTKRLLAFLTVGHGGIFLAGIGLLAAGALAGATLSVAAYGLLKAALFLAIGTTLNRLGASDELMLRGRGLSRTYAPLGLLWLVCGLGLAMLPPFGPFVSQALVNESARALGYGWLPPVFTLATIATAAAVLRAGGRIFLGLGEAEDPLLTQQPDEPEEGESDERGGRSPSLMLLPGFVLALAAFGLAFVPRLLSRADIVAGRFMDRTTHAHEVLFGVEPPAPPSPLPHPVGAVDYGYGTASVVGAVLLALALLYRRRFPGAVRTALGRILGPPIRILHAVHSGALGDYAAWLTFGAAVFGIVWAATLR